MDFSSFTAYPNGGSANIGDKGFRLGDPKVISFANDFYRPFKGITGVMELQPGPVNWGQINPLLAPERFAPKEAIMFKPTKIFIGSISTKNFLQI